MSRAEIFQAATVLLLGACISQRHNQHRASGTLQNAIGDAAQKKMGKRASAMGSKNDEIDSRIFCLGQDQLGRDPLEFYDR